MSRNWSFDLVKFFLKSGIVTFVLLSPLLILNTKFIEIEQWLENNPYSLLYLFIPGLLLVLLLIIKPIYRNMR